MTDYDYATIKATWYNLYDPHFQCNQAEQKLALRKDADVVISSRRKERGCGVFSDKPKIDMDGIGYHSCFCHPTYQNPNLQIYIQLNDAYSKGITPELGGYLDQSSKTMEILTLIESLKLEHQQKQQELTAKTGG